MKLTDAQRRVLEKLARNNLWITTRIIGGDSELFSHIMGIWHDRVNRKTFDALYARGLLKQLKRKSIQDVEGFCYYAWQISEAGRKAVGR